MAKQFAFHASEEIARDAVEQALIGGASPLQAALSAYFGAAGVESSVLLGPLVILLSGYGANRTFDGRVRQPGVGTKRPRGFLDGEAVPDAARVGIPMSVTAAFVALAYDRTHSLAFPTRYGIAAAKKIGAPARAELLSRLSRLGAGAFKDRQLHRPLVHAAGPSERGVVTAEDFEQLPSVDVASQVFTEEGRGSARPPFEQSTDSWQTVRAVDTDGVGVCLAYQSGLPGVAVPEWELSAPLCASPVMRGVSRVTPGTPCGGAPDVSVELGADGAAHELFGAGELQAVVRPR